MSLDIQPADLKQAQRVTDTIRRTEAFCVQKGLSACPQYESPLSSYDDSFSRVNTRGGIKKIFTELSKEKCSADFSVLDVAGQGTAFLECTDCGVSSITAISLGDYRKEEQKVRETSLGLNYIEGDIFDMKKRDEIRRKHYDLISFRPSGGRDIVSSPEIGFDLLSFMYSVLGENGVILMEISEDMLKNQGTRWVNNLSDTDGLEVRFSSPRVNMPSYLLLRKKMGGPKEISSILSNSPKSPEHAFYISTLTWERPDVLPF